jgi:hypothetical protein
MKYKVCYSEFSTHEIEINAKSAEEAERMVLDGDGVDYTTSHERDAELVSVNSVEAIG